jgi:predicted TIM-barrel fold metal-dependent hydrolase
MKEDLYISEFNPISTMVTKRTKIDHPKFPVIDAHNHLEIVGDYWMTHPVSEMLDMMDQSNVMAIVDLDGGWGREIYDSHWARFKEAAPDRFIMYAGVEWEKYQEMGNEFPDYACDRLREQVHGGAQGLKIDKRFGLEFKDPTGDLIKVDDPVLAPIWETVADLNVPVTIHVADPVAFFQPLDKNNERWELLHLHPEWHFPSPPYPSFLSIIERLENLVKRHPRTTFVGAHVGCYSENLEWVSGMLDKYPNFNVDICERLDYLGRQPYAARRFFMKYPDRILFGIDVVPSVDWYRLYARFLETDDEYFHYYNIDPPRDVRWFIYGIYLPDDVLKKVYSENAKRLLHLS